MALKFIMNLLKPFSNRSAINKPKVQNPTNNEEDFEIFLDESQKNYSSKSPEDIDVVIDGKTYHLSKDKNGGYKHRSDLGQEIIDRIIPTIYTYISAGIVIARIFIDTVNFTGAMIQYYDQVGNIVYRNVIEQKAKVQAEEFAQRYLTEAINSKRLDPRLLRKVDEAFQNTKQPKPNENRFE